MLNKNKDKFMFPARQVFFANGETPDSGMEESDRASAAPSERQELIALIGDSRITDLLSRARASLGKFNSSEAAERLVSIGKGVFEDCRQSVSKLNQAIKAAHASLEGKPVITADSMKHLANECWVNTKKAELLTTARVSATTLGRNGDVVYTFGDDLKRNLKISGYDVFIEVANAPGNFVHVMGGPPFADVKHPDYIPPAPKPKAPPAGSELNA